MRQAASNINVADLAVAVEELRKRLDRLSTGPSMPIDPLESIFHDAFAFVAMPFGPEGLQVVYDDYIKPTVEGYCSLKCIRGDDMPGSGVIMSNIINAISKAEVVIADLTDQNANVLYEVGIAHALSRPTLLMSQSLDEIPFDLCHRRVLRYEYSPHGCKLLEEKLKKQITEMRKQQP